MNRRALGRRGFAGVLAIAMLAIVSAAVLMLTRHFGLEVTRTRAAWEEAQLRQMLLAGGRDAAGRAKSWGDRPAPAHWQLDLPRALADAGATLSLDSATANDADAEDVHIIARFSQREMIQTVRLRRSGGTWSVSAVAWGN